MSFIQTVKKTKKRVKQVFLREIWMIDDEGNPNSRRLRFYKVLRILSLIFNGIGSNKIISRAAALSYSSLIAMGPLLAIMFMVSSWILVKSEDSNLAMGQFMRVAAYVFPQLTVGQADEEDSNQPNQGEMLEEKFPEEFPETSEPLPESSATLSPDSASSDSDTTDPESKTAEKEEESTPTPELLTPDGEDLQINPEFLKLIENFVTPTRSGTITSIGAIILLFISIQLIISVETAFNQIWGVRRGREWSHRIVFYWAFISLGLVVTLVAVALLSAGTIVNMVQNLPFGETLLAVIRWMAPLTSFVLLVGILTSFYRFIPNTAVNWGPALIGATVVALCLMLNNYFSFLYVQQVVRFQSLYGYTAIIPILMVGMYIFWIFILIGGQITYAVQNVDFLSKKEAWGNTSQTARETLALAILVIVARRFRECLEPVSIQDLAARLRAPGQVLNECLARLVDIRFLNQVASPNQEDRQIFYQPARPLNRIYLNEFKEAFERHGNNLATELILGTDDLLLFYQEKVTKALKEAVGNVSLEELFANQFPTLPEACPVND